MSAFLKITKYVTIDEHVSSVSNQSLVQVAVTRKTQMMRELCDKNTTCWSILDKCTDRRST
jgi:hypothetical protein